jgi:DNA repair exonuclease SbcCD nuclease subunit
MDREGLAYLALGHYHEITSIMNRTHTAMGYPGSPEGHDFSAPGMHYHLEIELEHGEKPIIRPVESSRTLYLEETIDCTGLRVTSDLAERVHALAPGEGPHAIHVTLTGRASARVVGTPERVLEAGPQSLDLLAWSDQTDDDEELDALARQSTSLGAFAERMARELADAPDDARRRALRRTRDVGIAAYRGEALPLPDMESREGAAS